MSEARLDDSQLISIIVSNLFASSIQFADLEDMVISAKAIARMGRVSNLEELRGETLVSYIDKWWYKKS